MDLKAEKFDEHEQGQAKEYNSTLYDVIDASEFDDIIHDLPETDLPHRSVMETPGFFEGDTREMENPDFTRTLKKRLASIKRKETNNKSKILSKIARRKVLKGKVWETVDGVRKKTHSAQLYEDVTLKFDNGRLSGIRFRGKIVMGLRKGERAFRVDRRATVAYAKFKKELTAVEWSPFAWHGVKPQRPLQTTPGC